MSNFRIPTVLCCHDFFGIFSVRSIGGNDSDWPTPPKMLRLNSSTADVSVTSSGIRDEASLILRGDLDPSDSMCAFLDGEVVLKQDLVKIQ